MPVVTGAFPHTKVNMFAMPNINSRAGFSSHFMVVIKEIGVYYKGVLVIVPVFAVINLHLL